jgi:hypothetical protein
MSTRTIEKYRRVAADMRMGGRPVTVANLARELKVEPSSVWLTVHRNDWRSQYVGVISSEDVTRTQYQRAAIALRERGIPITKAALARKIGIGLRAVQFYLKKHPRIFDSMQLAVTAREPAPDRYRRAAQMLREKGVPFVRKNLAEELGISLNAVCAYLNVHPAFAKEIGF